MTSIPRLVYGFLSQSDDALNLKIPWRTSVQDGKFEMNYSRRDAVITNLKAWAQTNWGERPMRFRFGLDARRMLFEPESVTKEVLLDNAQDQLGKYFGFLKLKQIKILSMDDDPSIPPNTLRFTLEAEFEDSGNQQVKISEDIGL